MPKKTNLITVPQQNEQYIGKEFTRWNTFVARFLNDRQDQEVKPSANAQAFRICRIENNIPRCAAFDVGRTDVGIGAVAIISGVFGCISKFYADSYIFD